MTQIIQGHFAQIIDGQQYATKYIAEIEARVELLKKDHNLHPSLAVILVGNDASSHIYVNNKMRRAKEIGLDVFFHHLDTSISEEELLRFIAELNQDPKINGILIQLPLPEHLDAHHAINQIDPNKDVDGFHYANVGKLNTWQECLEPGTPKGALLLIKSVLGNNLSGKKAVVIGRSQIVGRPMASMLLRENCTVTVMHSYSHDVIAETRTADILVSAVGKPHMIKKEWVKPGACVIDVGIVRLNNKLYGDVDFEEVVQVAGTITPVPGGVGPMTVACMLGNTIKAACIQHNIPFATQTQ